MLINRLMFIVLALSCGQIQAQTPINNPEFISVLRVSCPLCISKDNVLTPYAKELKNLHYGRVDVGEIEGVNWEVSELDSIDFSVFSSLEQLQLTGEVQSRIKKWPPQLQALDLSALVYTGDFPQFPPKLRYLHLHNNDLYYEMKNIFTTHTLPMGLEALILGGDINITALNSLPPQLKMLKATIKNKHDAAALISLLPNSLRVLRFEDSQLDTLPAHLPDSLRYLHLKQNYIKTLPILPDSLLVLDLDNNQIEHFPPVFPSNLRELYLHHNHLKTVPAQLPISLEKLRISNQFIRKLDLSALINLRELDANRNKLTKVILPEKVTLLDLNENNFVKFSSNLPLLKELYISNNRLTNLTLNTPQLEILTASCNRLKTLSLQQQPKLKHLYIQSNKIRSLSPLPFSLQILDCSCNRLKKLRVENTHLHYLSCGGNKIKRLGKIPPTLTRVIGKTAHNSTK